jgi:hypothetical protein
MLQFRPVPKNQSNEAGPTTDKPAAKNPPKKVAAPRKPRSLSNSVQNPTKKKPAKTDNGLELLVDAIDGVETNVSPSNKKTSTTSIKASQENDSRSVEQPGEKEVQVNAKKRASQKTNAKSPTTMMATRGKRSQLKEQAKNLGHSADVVQMDATNTLENVSDDGGVVKQLANGDAETVARSQRNLNESDGPSGTDYKSCGDETLLSVATAKASGSKKTRVQDPMKLVGKDPLQSKQAAKSPKSPSASRKRKVSDSVEMEPETVKKKRLDKSNSVDRETALQVMKKNQSVGDDGLFGENDIWTNFTCCYNYPYCYEDPKICHGVKKGACTAEIDGRVTLPKNETEFLAVKKAAHQMLKNARRRLTNQEKKQAAS